MISNLKETLIYILENYSKFKSKNFGLDESKDFRYKIKDSLNQIFTEEGIFEVKFSSGQGKWASVPWIAFFDKEITTKATEGYYIVYLFKCDMSGVYISLNQGFSFFKQLYKQDKFKNIKKVSNYWQGQLNIENSKCSFNKIHLNWKELNLKTDLPEGYELGNICSIYYDLNKLKKISNEELLSDLERIKFLLEEIKSKLTVIESSSTRKRDFSLFNKEIIEDYTWEYTSELKEQNELNLQNLSLGKKVDLPNQMKFCNVNNATKHTRKDYVKEHKRNTKQGKRAEKLVVELEKTRLSNNSDLKKYVDKIENRPIKVGDGDGYDILSYKLNKKTNEVEKHYIEVKSTFGNINTPFYMTKHEIDVAEEKGEQYSIYRLFKENNKWNYYVIDNPILGNKVKKQPIEYKIILK